MEGGTRSLQVLSEEVRVERDAQLRHFDALDSKAGVMLGFAGALVALAPVGLNVIVDLGRAAAVVGGLAALWAFWPRDYGLIAVGALRQKYLFADPAFTRVSLLDSHILSIEALGKALHEKGLRLKAALSAIAIATFLIAAGSALH